MYLLHAGAGAENFVENSVAGAGVRAFHYALCIEVIPFCWGSHHHSCVSCDERPASLGQDSTNAENVARNDDQSFWILFASVRKDCGG